MSIIHAHVEIDSADCDGRYEYGHVSVADPGESVESFRAYMGTLYDEEGSTVIVDTPDLFEFHHDTEEGYHHLRIEFCTDGCEDRPGTFRDHTAEAAGY